MPQGFDVPTLRDSSEVGLIVPVIEQLLSTPYLRELAQKAISEYNIENVCIYVTLHLYFLLSITFLTSY